ncbi:MAG: Uncharacterised protein [Flavobacteriia bacterium]|nr:MAG: Uncharacterised protein [Flavobacteriia bacterium]
MNSKLRPRTASPATPKPITEPPVKETDKAFARLVRAACVVRTLALVAMFIPIQPAKAEKKAPIKKLMAMTQSLFSTKVPDHPRRAAAMTEKMPSTRHSARRKANAPSAIYPANSFMFSSPESCLDTQTALAIMTSKPMIPRTGTK